MSYRFPDRISISFIKGLLFLSLFFSGITGKTQKYYSRVYTESDGLPSSVVSDVVQDSAGILWFATRSGISRYDGIGFTNYSFREGLRQGGYTFLKIDMKGNLWAVPESGEPGVFRFNGRSWDIFTCLDDPQIRISPISFDLASSGDSIIFAIGTCQNGMFAWENNEWIHYSTQNGLPDNCVRGILITKNGIWVATNKGLCLVRDNLVLSLQDLNRELPSRAVLAITGSSLVPSDSSGSLLWLLGDGWLGYLRGGRFSLCARNFKIRVGDFESRTFLYPDSRGGVYFGNPFYLYYVAKGKSPEPLGRKNGLVSDGATQVLVDREKNTWFASVRGITKVPLKRIRAYTQTEGLQDNEVSSAMEISPGRYIFGHHGYLTFLKDGIFTYLNLSPSGKIKPQEMRVLDMDVDRSGDIWIAASGLGLGKLDRQGKITWYAATQGLPGRIITVCIDPAGTVYAANEESLFIYDPGNDLFREVSKGRYTNTGIRKIVAGKENNLFLATFSAGLIERKDGTERNYRTPERNLGMNAYSFFQDSHGRKWVGTTDGLFFVADSVLQQCGNGGPGINRPVYIILEDRQGTLWFGTDNGVFSWDGEHLEHLSVNDGFSGLEVNRDAGFIDSNGDIWFGTNNGINVISSASGRLEAEIPPPLVSLTYAETRSDTLWLDRDHVLPSGRNTLIFHFRAVSLVDERQVFYKCMLEGSDKDWSSEIFTHTAQYRYSRLRPGTYRFCIKACNSLGIWSDPVCSATIKIRQPFWFQLWFVLTILAVVFSAAYGAGRVLVIQRYNRRLQKTVAIRTRALRRSEKELQESNSAKDNFFSIIAHDLKSPFNAILGMLELLTTEYSEFTDQERQKILLSLRNASVRTIDLLDNLLTWAQAQKGLIPFKPLKFDIKELIAENIALFEPTAQTKNILLTGPDPEPELVFADRNMISTVIRNLISNS